MRASELDVERLVLALTSASSLAGQRFIPKFPGVELALLYSDGRCGASAALLRYAPGAAVPRHRHPGYEHIYVLEGEQEDEHGKYASGTLIVNPPGTEHAVSSPNGCLVLAIWQRPVEFLGPLPRSDEPV